MILRRAEPYARAVVPNHKQVRVGTLRRILTDTGGISAVARSVSNVSFRRSYLVAIIRLAGPGIRTRFVSAKPASFNHLSYSGSL